MVSMLAYGTYVRQDELSNIIWSFFLNTNIRFKVLKKDKFLLKQLCKER